MGKNYKTSIKKNLENKFNSRKTRIENIAHPAGFIHYIVSEYLSRNSENERKFHTCYRNLLHSENRM